MQTYIVIGSGILGASTAYHLARAGAIVTLVDRQDVGQATDAAAGIICPWLSQRRNQAWFQLAKAGARYYDPLIKQLKDDGEKETGYKRVGAINIHTEAQRLDKLEERAYQRRQDSPEIGEITRLSAVETKRLFPPLAEQFESVLISGAARVNGRALRQSLVEASRKYGVLIVKGNATILFRDKEVYGVQIEGKTMLSNQVIVTAGAWAKELLQPLGIHFLGTFQKAQIVHLSLPGTVTENWPVVMPPNDQYILAFENSRLVVGATHENDTGYDCRVTAGGLYEIFDKALSIAPGLVNGTVLETRVGFRPFTPGFLPVIGTVPNYKGLLVANGLGASGLTMGPYLGSELAKLALGEPTEIDLNKYAVSGALQESI